MAEMIPKDKHLMKQSFKNLNAMKRYQTKEDIARERAELETMRRYELMKLKAQGRLELSMRALQRELYNTEEDTEE